MPTPNAKSAKKETWIVVATGTENVKLGAPEADSIGEAGYVRTFAVLHARSDLGEENVSLSEAGVAHAHLTQTAFLATDPAAGFVDIRHWDERDVAIVRQAAKVNRRIHFR